MQPQSAALAIADVEAVAKEFQSVDVGTFGLFAVHTELQSTFYELDDVLSHALSGSSALAEDKTAVGIASEWVSSSFDFLIEFVEDDVGK